MTPDSPKIQRQTFLHRQLYQDLDAKRRKENYSWSYLGEYLQIPAGVLHQLRYSGQHLDAVDFEMMRRWLGNSWNDYFITLDVGEIASQHMLAALAPTNLTIPDHLQPVDHPAATRKV